MVEGGDETGGLIGEEDGEGVGLKGKDGGVSEFGGGEVPFDDLGVAEMHSIKEAEGEALDGGGAVRFGEVSVDVHEWLGIL